MECVFVYPHQLFERHPALKKERPVFLIEDPLFFKDASYPVNFHKQKLVLHRASMNAYHEELSLKEYKVTRVEFSSSLNYLNGIQTIHVADLDDDMLERRLKKEAQKRGIHLIFYDTPAFLSPRSFLEEQLAGEKLPLMASFYMAQRKRLRILMEGNKPFGGKWSFDAENRKKLPASLPLPGPPPFLRSPHLEEALQYIQKHFSANLGVVESFVFPFTREQAKESLRGFLDKRFSLFGLYQDALDIHSSYMFHSLLSSSLNIGLLTPYEVVQEALKCNVPLNALEGFIRQIIGWREYVRGAYLFRGVEMRNRNFFNHRNRLSAKFYEGKTGLDPLDRLIERLNKTAYAHHIERLMVIGNLMLLLEIDPHEVYRWFMEYFIDAYDWVMVPNVYGMSQYADGGLMTSKPYFSSSNYIKKMSNYPEGSWTSIWDALFWRFVYKNRDILLANPRLSMMVKQLEKKENLKDLLKTADAFQTALLA